MLVTFNDGRASIWDISRIFDDADIPWLFSLKGCGNDPACSAFAFSPDSELLAISSEEGELQLWHTKTGELYRKLSGQMATYGFAFSLDGNSLASLGNETISYWDIRSGQLTRVLPLESKIKSLSFSPDGKNVACIEEEGYPSIVIRDLERNLILHEFQEEGASWLNYILFNPNAHSLAIVGWEGLSNYIIIRDITTGTKLQTICTDCGEIEQIAFSPDGRMLISSNRDGLPIRVWDVATGVPLLELDGKGAAFSPDGHLLATFDEYGVHFWRLGDSRPTS
jgi:WD40 repeat protein